MSLQRVCFTLQVKPHRLQEYKEKHRTVWPEMQEALRGAGWRNYSLFLREDGLLIGYVETVDFNRALSAMSATEVNGRWQREMAGFFDDEAGRLADEQMSPIPEVFHLS